MDKSMGFIGNAHEPLTVERIISQRRKRIAVRKNTCALVIKLWIFAAAGYVLMSFVFGVGVINGEGMYPRLRDGDLVIFYRLENEWNIGDIIAFSKDLQQQYGRIVAKGGDTVDMTEDGQLVVNDSIQQEEIFFATQKEGRATTFPLNLSEKEVFVLGDNRTIAEDSRDFGPVEITDIQGKVITLFRRRGL